MRRLTRNGKVAVVLANGEKGWFSQHKNIELVFLPELVELIESNEYIKDPLNYVSYSNNQTKVVLLLNEFNFNCKVDKYGHCFYLDKNKEYRTLEGCRDLRIEWIDINTTFTICLEDRDGDIEVIKYKDDTIWISV